MAHISAFSCFVLRGQPSAATAAAPSSAASSAATSSPPPMTAMGLDVSAATSSSFAQSGDHEEDVDGKETDDKNAAHNTAADAARHAAGRT